MGTENCFILKMYHFFFNRNISNYLENGILQAGKLYWLLNNRYFELIDTAVTWFYHISLSVCLSVSPPTCAEQLGCCWMYFSEIFILTFYWNLLTKFTCGYNQTNKNMQLM